MKRSVAVIAVILVLAGVGLWTSSLLRERAASRPLLIEDVIDSVLGFGHWHGSPTGPTIIAFRDHPSGWTFRVEDRSAESMAIVGYGTFNMRTLGFEVVDGVPSVFQSDRMPELLPFQDLGPPLTQGEALAMSARLRPFLSEEEIAEQIARWPEKTYEAPWLWRAALENDWISSDDHVVLIFFYRAPDRPALRTDAPGRRVNGSADIDELYWALSFSYYADNSPYPDLLPKEGRVRHLGAGNLEAGYVQNSQTAPSREPAARDSGAVGDGVEAQGATAERGADTLAAPPVEEEYAVPAGLRVPAGFRAARGAIAEEHSGTGWASAVVHEKTGIEMVFIPAGSFVMGRPPTEGDLRNHEGPQHMVTLTRPFYIGRYEVTQEQWLSVMDSNPSVFIRHNNPVESVTWDDCQEFLEKAGGGLRLPTEAEWEYACRAGTTTDYSFGDDTALLGDYAWFWDNTGGFLKTPSPRPVGGKLSNAWGLYDMHGNVQEWCSDWYGEYLADSVIDPQGPASGDRRVVRGGDWSAIHALVLRSTRRGTLSPGRADDRCTGFRVARTIELDADEE